MLACGATPHYAVVCDDYLTTAGQKSLAQLDFGDAPVYRSDAGSFASLSSTVHSQGVLAVTERPDRDGQLEELLGTADFILYLDGVRDPGNLGTIIRTAAAFSVDLLVLSPDCVEAANPKVIRASAGVVFCLPTGKILDPETFLDSLRSHSVELLGTAADGSEYVDAVQLPPRVCLAFGSEAGGLSDLVRSRSSKLLAVRTAAAVESLNVAAAAAITINLVAGKLGVK